MKTRLTLFVTAVVTCLLFSRCLYRSEPATFLIPEDYRGSIFIVFDQPCGHKPEYENDRRVYHIPENGILLTQFQRERGLIDHQYFFVDKAGNRKRLLQLGIDDEPLLTSHPRKPLHGEAAIGGNRAPGVMMAGNNREIRFYRFYVVTYPLPDDDRVENRKEWRQDSLKRVLIENCLETQKNL